MEGSGLACHTRGISTSCGHSLARSYTCVWCGNDAYLVCSLVLSGFPSNYVAGVFVLNDEHLVLSPTTSGRPVAKVGSLHAEEPPLIKGPLLRSIILFEPQVCQKVNYFVIFLKSLLFCTKEPPS